MNQDFLDLKGVHTISVDTKGRMALPAKYRHEDSLGLDQKYVLTIDTEDKCLLLYPESVWGEIQNKLTALSSFKPGAKRLKRLLMGHASDIELDAAGRIRIPPPLRDHASLTKKVVMLGQGNKFEIWDEAIWQSRCDEYLEEKLDEETLMDIQELSI